MNANLWEITPVALAVLAVLLHLLEHPKLAGLAGYLSMAASQLARLRPRRVPAPSPADADDGQPGVPPIGRAAAVVASGTTLPVYHMQAST